MSIKITLVAIISFLSLGLFGQKSFDAVASESIKQWITDDISDYHGVYHFGDSEWESSLSLIYDSGKWYAQLHTGSWSEKGEQLAWISNYENFENLRIEGNKFYSDKTNGEFVYYDEKENKNLGLKVYASWSGEGNEEIGFFTHSLNVNYVGRFPQASYKKLERTELSSLSKRDLKIMRNEVFARYGYIFKSNSEMETYFKKQNWYSAHHTSVGLFLTSLEKENIALILKVEKD